MAKLTRRRFISLAGACGVTASSTSLFAPRVLGQAKAKLVVIGGGPGGGTVARTVNREAAGAIEVTLIEPQQSYTTFFFSNLYVGGLRDLQSITFTYEKVRRDGVKVVHAAAAGIDRDKREVAIAGGERQPYDRLVVAPGIDLKWDSVPGYSEAAAAAMPHAWKLGGETELLVRKLDAVQDGDTIVMVAPPNPSRCPTAPYERVSMFAHVLKSRGYAKASIVVLDTKPSFPEQPLFQDMWESRYPGMIEWQDPGMHGGIKHIDPATGEVTTDLGTYKAALANIIPAQMAGRIARDAGLADKSGFCQIDPATMKSTSDANVFVIGDACFSGDMPKAASSAHSEAKVVAATIRAELAGGPSVPARYTNACWSLIAPELAVKTGGTYEPGEGRIKAVTTVVSRGGEAAEVRRQNYRESVDWYNEIVADMFG